jgi:membrane fusion protein, macrolide-specific efflux system
MRSIVTVIGKWKRVIKGSAIVVVIGLSAFFLVGRYLLPEEEVIVPPKIITANTAVSYSTIETKKGSIEVGFSCLGNFVVMDQVNLGFKERGGNLKAIYVRPGDSVKKGQVLAELENDDLDNKIKQEELLMQKAQLAYEEVKASKKDAYSVKQAALDVELAKLKLEDLKQEFKKNRIVSPVSGIVDFVDTITSGDFIDSNREVIRIADDRKLQLVYSGDHEPDLKKGMVVSVKIGDKVYCARVKDKIKTSVQEQTAGSDPQTGDPQSASNASSGFLVTFSVQKLDVSKVSIGEYANIDVILAKKDNTIVLPSNVVNEYGGKNFVKVFENGIQTERYVVIGLSTPSQVEITSGLKVGEKVIE